MIFSSTTVYLTAVLRNESNDLLTSETTNDQTHTTTTIVEQQYDDPHLTRMLPVCIVESVAHTVFSFLLL